MCGIWAYLGSISRRGCGSDHEALWKKGVSTLSARGPEDYRWTDVKGSSGEIVGTLCFTRLAINGLHGAAMQPFNWNDMYYSMCNGEIYNSRELEEKIGYLSATNSDCEILLPLWEHCEKDPVAFARALDGVFAVVLYDRKKDTWVVARDPYGVRPLFYIQFESGESMFASERKALEPFCENSYDVIQEFPPGNVWSIKGGRIVQKDVYHIVPWLKHPRSGVEDLRVALEEAVKKRVLTTERPVAALLSGGIDSSLIAALCQKMLKEAGKPTLKTFSIGMAGGTDLAYARMVADHIGSDHTEIVMTAEEMFEVIPQVIRDIESYDITTVRASVGNWLIAREIRRRTDCKVVFNGDGSDEVFGSYLYFYRAPSDFAFERETQRLLEEISKYDVLRSDRCISSHGLEARTPFLDKQFVSVAMSYATGLRRPGGGRVEKQILREAFEGTGLLPREVLWRQKEAFSDGVSSQEKSWYEIIQEKIVSEGIVEENWKDLAYAANYWPAPHTAEAYWYRKLFERMYSHTGTLWPYWMPKWSPETSDPSARTLKGGAAAAKP